MIHIERLPKPNILLEKEHDWTDKFIHSGKTRPDNTKYGHKTILQTLQSMSFTKCFYCEQKLKGVASEIDHLIEVNIEKKQAYSWENLYLSCENCNNKINHLSISIHDVLIPCKDNDKEIQQHLTYNDEQITALNHSPKGWIPNVWTIYVCVRLKNFIQFSFIYTKGKSKMAVAQ